MSHCDDGICDLGCAWFTCPEYSTYEVNHDDLCWDFQKDLKDKQVKVGCRKCGVDLLFERRELENYDYCYFVAVVKRS